MLCQDHFYGFAVGPLKLFRRMVAVRSLPRPPGSGTDLRQEAQPPSLEPDANGFNRGVLQEYPSNSQHQWRIRRSPRDYSSRHCF